MSGGPAPDYVIYSDGLRRVQRAGGISGGTGQQYEDCARDMVGLRERGSCHHGERVRSCERMPFAQRSQTICGSRLSEKCISSLPPERRWRPKSARTALPALSLMLSTMLAVARIKRRWDAMREFGVGQR